MLKKRFLLGMVILALVFGLTVFGCGGGDGGGESSNGNGKTITITGITGGAGEAFLEGHSSYLVDDIWVWAEGRISGSSVTFSLLNEDDAPFTGSGSFYLGIELDNNDYSDEFVYTNGKTMAELGLSSSSSEDEFLSKIPKYNISSANSTIAVNQFIKFPDWWYEVFK
jgi:hypothetical protein